MSEQTLGELCAQIAAEHAANTRAELATEDRAGLTRRLEAYALALSELAADELESSAEETRGR